MPQSLAYLLTHIVFSTKYREPVLHAGVRPRLFAFLAEAPRKTGCECYRAGGIEDLFILRSVRPA